MRNANLLDYYNLLFTTEIAVFGIISAVILVFVQLVFSNYSYRQIWHVIKDRWLLLFFFFSSVDLLMTSGAVYFLVWGRSSLLAGAYSYLQPVVRHPLYALACLLLIFVSICFFVVLIVKNINYLQPHRAIFLIAKGIAYEDVRDHLWKTYELEPPFDLRWVYTGFPFEDDASGETEEERRARLNNEVEARNQELESIQRQIDSIKRKVADAADPLLPMRDMMIQFVKRSDISSLNEASNVLSTISADFITRVPVASDAKWLPEGSLPKAFTMELIETLETLMEISDKEGLESAKRETLEVSFSYATHLLDLGYFQELERVEAMWRKVADDSLGVSPTIYQQVINYHCKVGERVLHSFREQPANGLENRKRVLDRVFQSIGWLGERMLVKVPLEDSPIMTNLTHSTEHDALFNCLLGFSDTYNYEHPTSYPLIYFDALFVVFLKLIQTHDEQRHGKHDDDLFVLMFAFSSFAEKAIEAQNSQGAALAALNLWKAYKELKDAELHKKARDAINLLVGVGMLAAAHQSKLEGVDFLNGPIHEWVLGKLVEVRENVEDAVMQSYLKGIGSEQGHDDRWTFITRLGQQLGTNFGLAFDPATGEIFPDDDPRRR